MCILAAVKTKPINDALKPINPDAPPKVHF